MTIDFDKQLYWIDLEAIMTLNEWYLYKEDELRQKIVKANQELWNYEFTRRKLKTNKTILIPKEQWM